MKLNFPVVSNNKKKIDEALAIFVGTTSFAHHLVDNEDFVKFVSMLNHHYRLPCRKTLKQLVAQVAERTMANIKNLLVSSAKIAVCADIWTQKKHGGGIFGYYGAFLLRKKR